MGSSLSLKSQKLSQEQLLEYAKTASAIRAAVTRRVLQLGEEAAHPTPVTSIAVKSRAEKVQAAADARNYHDAHRSVNPVSPTRRRRRMCELSSATRLRIVKMALFYRQPY